MPKPTIFPDAVILQVKIDKVRKEKYEELCRKKHTTMSNDIRAFIDKRLAEAKIDE